jgi:predicted nucleotidyltransferase
MVIQAMADRIVCRFQLEMVVLFGSYARNEATADSDVDLLVVMPVGSYKRELRRQIYRALDDRVLPLDVIVVTPEQVARQRSQVGTIVYPALRDGRVLYQRPQ